MALARSRAARLSGVLLAGTLFAGLLTGPAAARSAALVPADRAANSRLQDLLDQLVNHGATGVLARVDDGRQVRRYASGRLRLGSGRPATTRARFRVGSVTKSFVSTVMLQMVGEGRLKLSDPVSRWLPGLVGRRHRGRVLELPHGSAVGSTADPP